MHTTHHSRRPNAALLNTLRTAHPPHSMQVMASEKQMATKFNAAQATADEWLRRAELAVAKGQDELAREALLRRKTYDQAAASLKVRWCLFVLLLRVAALLGQA
jgi:hypothetical protein